MCGIVAYCGKNEQTIPTLVTGLKRLEYRGYDSAGVAYHSDGHIRITKAVGKVSALEDELGSIENQVVDGVGIAHTRWATHGPATLSNAHPHSSSDKKVWIVHNGIIENYKELKQELESNGHTFESETDTEVVAKLLGTFYQGDMRKMVLDTVGKLKGAFSLCIIHEDEPNRLIGVRMASPLVVGITDDEVILASDVSAIVERTKRVIFLEDGELIDINNTDYEIVTFDNLLKKKEISDIDWDVQTASKGNYEHYLLKEIMEQPQVIHDSIRGRIIEDRADIRFGGLIDVTERLKKIDNIVLLGVGTSYYAAKMGELYFNALSGVKATAVLSPEYRYTKNIINKNTWMIAISQSGETADTIAAIEEAKLQGALITGVVNVVGSTISRMTDAGIYNHIGPEISVASTKAFTSQSLILLMQAILLGRQKGLDFLMAQKILKAIQDLPNVLEDLLKDHGAIQEVAEMIYGSPNLIYLGRQYNYPIAMEGALKIKEIAYIHAEGLSAGELKHGFIALIDENLPTIALIPDDSLFDKMRGNIAEVKARNGKVIAIANQDIQDVDKTIIVPNIGVDYLQPLVNNVVLQLLAYYVAKNKNLNIDQPRNLAKSVTVE